MHEKYAVRSQKIPHKEICGFHLATRVFVSFCDGLAILGGKSGREGHLGEVDRLGIQSEMQLVAGDWIGGLTAKIHQPGSSS